MLKLENDQFHSSNFVRVDGVCKTSYILHSATSGGRVGKDKIENLTKEAKAGSHRAIARIISIIEDREPGAEKCIELLFPETGRAHIVGITGSPGAGKSTLVDQIGNYIAQRGLRVAVVAVDPSSPFTGGALLGDRIRMAKATMNERVFVRSMASRGALGGIAPSTSEVLYLLDAAGFDYIIVETVGVGQGEVEIVRVCDTCLVTLVPGMGDEVQALKAGILEIADVFVINKADYQGADRLKRELLGVLALNSKETRTAKIIETVATEGKGVEELFHAIQEYHTWAKESGALIAKRKLFLQGALFRQISSELLSSVVEFAKKQNLLESSLSDMVSRRKSPLIVARNLIDAKASSPASALRSK